VAIYGRVVSGKVIRLDDLPSVHASGLDKSPLGVSLDSCPRNIKAHRRDVVRVAYQEHLCCWGLLLSPRIIDRSLRVFFIWNTLHSINLWTRPYRRPLHITGRAQYADGQRLRQRLNVGAVGVGYGPGSPRNLPSA
jgi:hypothetical protein